MWSVELRNVAAQLILHIRWQKEEIARLEKEVHRLQSPDLLTPPKKQTWEPPADPAVRGTLHERIRAAFGTPTWESPSFRSSLQRAGIGLDEALEIALARNSEGDSSARKEPPFPAVPGTLENRQER
jgi:hypothetical protein